MTAQASGIVAHDFFTVDTVLLRRLDALVFIDLATPQRQVTVTTVFGAETCSEDSSTNYKAGRSVIEREFSFRHPQAT